MQACSSALLSAACRPHPPLVFCRRDVACSEPLPEPRPVCSLGCWVDSCRPPALHTTAYSLRDVSRRHGARRPACSCSLHLRPGTTPKPTLSKPPHHCRAAVRSASLPLPCVVPTGFLLTDPRPPNLHSSRQLCDIHVCTPPCRRQLSWYIAVSMDFK
ncbi:unnamed protein product [Rangifer tarandus platyrhynchus]|uniref:Uncharacterized protein n=2 Tax=Rangifer tarandus platyrhynchus TaxID=3082113 RepID=A0ABN8ZHJ2_RANTA|nr:unnamed protein product [Rangifer tarandus platyrhynchus]